MSDKEFMRSDPESIAAYLAKKRGATPKSRFAELLGVSRAIVDQWERGTYVPRPKVLEVLGLEPISYFRVLDDSPLEPVTVESQAQEITRLKRALTRAKRTPAKMAAKKDTPKKKVKV